jgi:hypothetical protein
VRGADEALKADVAHGLTCEPSRRSREIAEIAQRRADDEVDRGGNGEEPLEFDQLGPDRGPNRPIDLQPAKT